MRIRIKYNRKQYKLSKMFCTNGVTLYTERRFKFPDEQHFVNKTVKYTAALLKHVKLAAFQSQETIMMFPELGCLPLCQRFRKFRSEFKWKGPFHVSVSSDRIIRDHFWRWSTYFGWNVVPFSLGSPTYL